MGLPNGLAKLRTRVVVHVLAYDSWKNLVKPYPLLQRKVPAYPTCNMPIKL